MDSIRYDYKMEIYSTEKSLETLKKHNEIFVCSIGIQKSIIKNQKYFWCRG